MLTAPWCVSQQSEAGRPLGSSSAEDSSVVLIIQGTREIKSAEEYTTAWSAFPSCHEFILFFLPLFPSHLAALQSIPINIQCLCTLSSCLSKCHKLWQKYPDDKHHIFSFTQLIFSSPFFLSKLQSYKINQHLLRVEKAGEMMMTRTDEEWLPGCLSKGRVHGSCLGADYLQQPEIQTLEI